MGEGRSIVSCVVLVPFCSGTPTTQIPTSLKLTVPVTACLPSTHSFTLHSFAMYEITKLSHVIECISFPLSIWFFASAFVHEVTEVNSTVGGNVIERLSDSTEDG